MKSGLVKAMDLAFSSVPVWDKLDELLATCEAGRQYILQCHAYEMIDFKTISV